MIDRSKHLYLNLGTCCMGVEKVLGLVSNDCSQSENCRLALATLAIDNILLSNSQSSMAYVAKRKCATALVDSGTKVKE